MKSQTLDSEAHSSNEPNLLPPIASPLRRAPSITLSNARILLPERASVAMQSMRRPATFSKSPSGTTSINRSKSLSSRFSENGILKRPNRVAQSIVNGGLAAATPRHVLATISVHDEMSQSSTMSTTASERLELTFAASSRSVPTMRLAAPEPSDSAKTRKKPCQEPDSGFSARWVRLVRPFEHGLPEEILRIFFGTPGNTQAINL